MQNVSAVVEYLMNIGETELVCDIIEEDNLYGILVVDNIPTIEKINSWSDLTRFMSENRMEIFYQM
jgi:hypothetical protein